MSRFIIDLHLPDTLKKINGFYEPGTVERIKATDKKMWILILELEDKINAAILADKDDEAEKLLVEYEKKWRAAHKRQQSLFAGGP